MKKMTYGLLAIPALVLALTTMTSAAQSIYAPYGCTNFAGNPGSVGSKDGEGGAARFNNPGSVAFDEAGNLYVADFGNHTIRKISPGGAVTTLAGLAGSIGSTDGPGSAARFNGPATLDSDSNGNVYVAEYYSHTIRKITPAGVVSTIAGMADDAGDADGDTTTARFNHPIGVAVDQAGNVYVGDSGNHTIRKITPSGIVTTLAGVSGSRGSADGPGDQAEFNDPHHVRVDQAGNVYVADTGNNTIRKITPGGVVSTLAGRPGVQGNADGLGADALFTEPFGVAVNREGFVFVADTSNHAIRRITPAGAVTTLAGLPGRTGQADGIGSVARFNMPLSIALDHSGNLFIADYSNHRISKATPIFTFDATSTASGNPGALLQSRLTGPPGDQLVIETSVDLQTWTTLQSNILGAEGFELSIPVGNNQNRFFRARLVP
jgi:sugar lactone lactonase YvrE